jgi:hypothetical protein
MEDNLQKNGRRPQKKIIGRRPQNKMKMEDNLKQKIEDELKKMEDDLKKWKMAKYIFFKLKTN